MRSQFEFGVRNAEFGSGLHAEMDGRLAVCRTRLSERQNGINSVLLWATRFGGTNPMCRLLPSLPLGNARALDPPDAMAEGQA